MNLLYRQSPEPLRAWNNEQVGFFDPPPIIPGMITVTTDTAGRLTGFWAIPQRNPKNRSERTKVDWNKFFVEAGLDQTKFEQTEPDWIPVFGLDERMAWKGTMVDWADIPLQIEAASFEGKPVYFRIVYPWTAPPQGIVTARITTIISMVISVILLFGVIVLVWHNVNNGRADLRGTAKFGLFFLVLGVVTGLITFDHVLTSSQEYYVLLEILRRSLFNSIAFGFIYCALEPFVRRWWSEYLISWSRLLAGDFRDPMVGRDILIGGAWTVVALIIGMVIRFVRVFGLGETLRIETNINLSAADSFLDGMALITGVLIFVTANGLGFLVMFLIVYFFIRNKKAALILSGILLIGLYIGGNNNTVPWVNVAIFALMLMIIFNRFGLVAFISASFFNFSIASLPLSLDPASIVFPQTIATLVILFVIIGYAAYISIGGAKMFGGKSFWGE